MLETQGALQVGRTRGDQDADMQAIRAGPQRRGGYSSVELLAVSLVAGLFASACAVWMVWLMWKAFAVSCNQRGGRAAAIFVAAVIAGEVATKFLLVRMLGGLTAAGVPGVGVPGGS